MKIKYPSVIEEMTNAEYHSGAGDEAIGSSSLKTLATKTPNHFKNKKPQESKPYFDKGTACHTAILEPHLFKKNVIRGGKDRRQKEYKEAMESKTSEQVVLPDSDYEDVLRIKDAVSNSPQVNKLLYHQDARSEVSAFCIDKETGIKLKCRPDKVRPSKKDPSMDIIIDLKTTVDASREGFERACGNFGYHIQEAFYRRCWEQATNRKVAKFYFLAVEKEPPYAFSIFELGDMSIIEGDAVVEKALQTYSECQKTGIFPSYDTEIQKIEIPPYFIKLTEPTIF